MKITASNRNTSRQAAASFQTATVVLVILTKEAVVVLPCERASNLHECRGSQQLIKAAPGNPMSGSLSNDSSLGASARMKAEAKNLLDVAEDAKISEKSSRYLKSLLEDVSTDFSSYDTSKIQRRDLDSDSESSSSLDKDSSEFIGSADLSLSLSDSHDNDSNVEATLAKKQLLMKILAFPTSSAPERVQQPNDFQRYQESQRRVEYNLSKHESGIINQFDAEFGQFDRNQVLGNREGDKLDSQAEIGRLTDMLKDRRMQFRDLVSIRLIQLAK